MLDSSQHWNLFGLDLRHLGQYLRSGWQEFLWDTDSPVLAAVDEVVLVRQAGEPDCHYRAGKPTASVAAANGISSTAVLLPDSLVLLKALQIPLAAEAEIESVIALEVNASSPFTAEDTSAGWVVTERTDTQLSLALVISSRSAVMAHVAEHFGSHDVQAQEIWANVHPEQAGGAGGTFVVLSGFGESARRSRNARRMTRLAMMAGYCLAAVLLVSGLIALGKYLELQRVEAQYEEARVLSETPLGERERLADAKVVIAEAQVLTETYPSPLPEFMRLTKMLGEDTWISSAKVDGNLIRIEGESGNAAAVMQQLLDDPAYVRVDAVSAFKKVRSGMERFALELVVAGDGVTQ